MVHVLFPMLLLLLLPDAATAFKAGWQHPLGLDSKG
jgi:hypothetical protein